MDENATEKEIKKAYHKLSKKYHPDKQHGKTEEEKAEAEQKMKELNEAQEVLLDKNKRQKFDEERKKHKNKE